MTKNLRSAIGLAFMLCGAVMCLAEEPADPFMGDWQGKLDTLQEGRKAMVAQVIPLGRGIYQANLLAQFDARVAPLAVLDGTVTNGTLVLVQRGASGPAAAVWVGTMARGRFTGHSAEGLACTFRMKPVLRLSPTLGARPPKGALVLLGKKTKALSENWQRDKDGPIGWTLQPGGVARVASRTGSLVSRKEFGNHRLHAEFRLPCEPELCGQNRGNSGVYLQSHYEVQVLDSYGLEGGEGDCGAIYSFARPKVNASAPPLQWQTYDITFTAPVMNGDQVVKPPRITVLHNGVKIHDHLELSRMTDNPLKRKPGPTGPLYLQDHSHPVEYRNIWVEELP